MTYNTPPAYPLVFLWPLVLSMISGVYSSKYCIVPHLHVLDAQLFFSHDHPHLGPETG